jgi:hypothetical protein
LTFSHAFYNTDMTHQDIYVVNDPKQNLKLCEDNLFRSFYSACGTKDDTKIYRRLSAALRRLKKVSQRLHPNSMLLVRTKDQPDRFLDRDGNEVRA